MPAALITVNMPGLRFTTALQRRCVLRQPRFNRMHIVAVWALVSLEHHLAVQHNVQALGAARVRRRTRARARHQTAGTIHTTVHACADLAENAVSAWLSKVSTDIGTCVLLTSKYRRALSMRSANVLGCS